MNKIKQFSSFAVIIAIMKICDHSEVIIGQMFILKTNPWQTANSKANTNKFLRVIHILLTLFYKKQNRKVTSSEFA